jgi:Putative protein-S-isoprenylcysteine methyltransferase
MKNISPRFAVAQFFALITPLLLFGVSAGMIYESTLVLAFILLFNLLVQIRCYNNRPELFSERLKLPKSIKTWYVLISVANSLLLYILYFMAGLCRRYAITSFNTVFSPVIIVCGACLYLLATLLSSWAMIVNPYYSTFVYIQSDRCHEVVKSGPYRWVRHPGYLAILVQYISLPLIFNVWVLYCISLILVVLLLIRTFNEGSLLSIELEGYKSYKAQVRALIIPFIL